MRTLYASSTTLLKPNCSPRFIVALVRTPRLSPYHARFVVPLHFSKYDIRDYLYHAYNVKVYNVRAHVKQMPVRDMREQPRRWFRPESIKYMTVEMEQPFVWPEVPDLEPWGDEQRKAELADAEKMAIEREKRQNRVTRGTARELREQVKKLLYKDVARPGQAAERQQLLDETITEELEAEQAEREARMLQRMSRLQLWERERTGKVVESDKRKHYAIKA